MLQYLDKKGRLLFVAQSFNGMYGTFYRKKEDGGKHRVKSPALPMRKTRMQAEDDFNWYVLGHDLVPVTVSHEE